MEILPTHVAIVPDGNRRWAECHGLSRLEGHQKGAEAMHRITDFMADAGIQYLTLWGFSTDNWKRTPEEVEDIHNLLRQWLDLHTVWAHDKGIRLRHLGRFMELPQPLREAITRAVDLTQNNAGMTLNIAFNYSGRAEIVDAVNRILEVGVGQIDEESLSYFLYSGHMPDVDLVIRTAGEYRVSNFLLWQTAYSEFYFTNVLWPDFGVEEANTALHTYSERKRTFGGE